MENSVFDYAPRPPLYRRRSSRIIVCVLMLAIASVGGLKYGKPLYIRAQTLRYQRQCLQFQFPPGFVTFESDPKKAADLINRGTHVPMGAEHYTQNGTQNVPRPPFAAFMPDFLEKFNDYGECPQMFGAYAFLHERQTPSGKHLLIEVYSAVALHGDGFMVWAEVTLCIVSKARQKSAERPRQMKQRLGCRRRLRIRRWI